MNDKFDDELFELLKEVKTIPNFFDVVFGFLFRRTDFYHIAHDPNVGVGLKEGEAEIYVKNAFMKYRHANKIFETHDVSGNELPIEYGTEEITIVEEKACSSSIENKKPAQLENYNGATYDKYSWSQSVTDVDIQVKIPSNLTSKQLSVNVTSKQICVKMKCSDEVFIEGDFCQNCKKEETIWSIDGSILQIHLEKVQEKWWNCLITTEDKLDLNKIDCSRPFYELSEEAQAKIEELTWDQERKRQGLPTVDQLKLEETLKKAWNAEGSPFTGDFDPTKVKLG